LFLTDYVSVETASITSKSPETNGYDLVHVQASGHAYGPHAYATEDPNSYGSELVFMQGIDPTLSHLTLTTSGWHDLGGGFAVRYEGQPSIISWSANVDFHVLPGVRFDAYARLYGTQGEGWEADFGVISPLFASISTTDDTSL